jgi:hypothetical protein
MYWDVIAVKPESYLTLSVYFSDGLQGHVHFLQEHLTGVFSPLKDPSFFEQVFVDNGVVTWPGELDLAPDAMYHAIKKQGQWVLS